MNTNTTTSFWTDHAGRLHRAPPQAFDGCFVCAALVSQAPERCSACDHRRELATKKVGREQYPWQPH